MVNCKLVVLTAMIILQICDLSNKNKAEIRKILSQTGKQSKGRAKERLHKYIAKFQKGLKTLMFDF